MKKYEKVFPNASVVGFHNSKSLKNYLVRAARSKTNKNREMSTMWEKKLKLLQRLQR